MTLWLITFDSLSPVWVAVLNDLKNLHKKKTFINYCNIVITRFAFSLWEFPRIIIQRDILQVAIITGYTFPHHWLVLVILLWYWIADLKVKITCKNSHGLEVWMLHLINHEIKFYIKEMHLSDIQSNWNNKLITMAPWLCVDKHLNETPLLFHMLVNLY